jgi:hypothetical protein
MVAVYLLSVVASLVVLAVALRRRPTQHRRLGGSHDRHP